MTSATQVLVVEDETFIRLGLMSALEDEGFQVFDAPNADRAIRILEQEPGIRLVVTDVDMPGSMDGIKLAHFVASRWPPVRLIVVSGKVDLGAAHLPSGAKFLSKPFPNPRLVGLMQDLLQS
jgi:DNA-binding NtrC family response regulator